MAASAVARQLLVGFHKEKVIGMRTAVAFKQSLALL
jgi:hypothetical protein